MAEEHAEQSYLLKQSPIFFQVMLFKLMHVGLG